MKWTMSLLLTLLFIGGCNSDSPKNAKVNSEDEKVFYTAGTMFGSKLKQLKLSESEINVLMKGLYDATTGKKLAVDVKSYRIKVQEMFRNRMKANSIAMKKEGEKYMETFLKEEGAKKTKSGLGYKILKEGDGKMPKATDTVEVHYHGTFINGNVFDSSVQRGKKVTFQLNRVVKGWTEGLALVKEGGKIKLVIPAELGYGENGLPPKIPGGSTLVFEIELFKIKA